MRNLLVIGVMYLCCLACAVGQDTIAKWLDVGNFYAFRVNLHFMGGYEVTGIFTETVVDDTTIEGLKFFRFDSGLFERSDSSIIEQTSPSTNFVRELQCDFSRNMGDTMSTADGRMVVDGKGSKSFFGEPHQFVDLLPIDQLPVGLSRRVYAKKFGMVSSYRYSLHSSSSTFMKGAMINGVVYGWVGFFLSTDSVNFDSLQLGSIRLQEIEARNPGQYPMNLSAAALAGGAFGVTPQTLTIAPGDTAHFTLSFSPTFMGSQNDEIRFLDKDEDYYLRLPLHGVGTAPIVVLTSRSVNFGNLVVGAAKDTFVIIENNGNEFLRIATATVNTRLFTVDVSDSLVAPGGQVRLLLTFSPMGLGEYADQMVIRSNAIPPADTIVLSGSAKSHGSLHLLDGIPSSSYLSQNFPNPFNSSTTFSFGLSSSCHVTLSLYSYLGTEVTSLLEADLPKGNFAVTWTPGRLASGVYLYRLSSGDFVSCKKLLLLK